MKKKIKLIISAIAMLVLVIAFDYANAQAPICVVNYNATGLVPGATITVPITLTGTTVGNFQFILQYDRDVLTYVSETHSVPSGLFQVFEPFTNATLPGQVFTKVQFGYTGGSPGYTYSNQTVVNLQFTFNGGSTNIVFYNKSLTVLNTGAQFTYIKANPYGTINLATTFTNGSTSGSYATLTSVSGGGDWKTAATWVENKIPSKAYDVFITGSTVTDTSTTGRCHNLTINAGGQLTVNASKSLAVAGNFHLKSDATSTGSFISFGTTTVTGTNTVERYTTGNWNGVWPDPPGTIWHYISSPVSGGTINSYLGSLLNHWNESTALWVPETLPVTNPLVVNKGYSTATTSNQVITFTGGTLNSGDQTIGGLTRTGTGGFSGANLVGNCYPSAFTWNDAYVTRTNVDAAAYFWNGATYASYLSTDASFFKIPAEQGYFVFVTSGFTTGSMNISNGGRDHAGVYLKSSAIDQLSLKVNGNNLEDITSIRFNTASTEGFDGEYDALKLWGVTACPQVYSIIPETNLSINSLPSVTSQTVIPVGFKAGVADTYTLTASGMETFTPGTQIFLEDLVTSQVQNLNTNPVYSFSAVAGSPSQRFNLHFSPVGMPEGKTSNIKIYAANHFVYVNIPTEMSGTITIYDLLGKEITHQPIQSNGLNKVNLNVQTGYYLVRVLGDNATVTGKVFIQ